MVKIDLKNFTKKIFPKTEGFEVIEFENLIPYIDETNSKITDVSGNTRSAILKVNGARDGEDPDLVLDQCGKF